MRDFWHGLWGCAHGPITRIAPWARVVCAFLVFNACMIAPVINLNGGSIIAATVLLWIASCRPPVRVLKALLVLGAFMFLPYLIYGLFPGFFYGIQDSENTAFNAAVSVIVHGLAGLIVTVTCVTVLDSAEFRSAFLTLPVPVFISEILLQIVHQAGSMIHETERVFSAMAVRGAMGKNHFHIKVVASFPQAWMLRMIGRVERVAEAMEVRGYAGAVCTERRMPVTMREVLAIACSAILFSIAVLTRVNVI